MPVDVANFLARNSPRFNPTAMEREQYQNALMRGQVRAQPQQQAMNDQLMQMREQGMQNDQAALTQQQQDNARGVFGHYSSAIAQSQSPLEAYRRALSDPGFRSAAKLLGLPEDQLTIGPEDSDESIRQQATDMARMMGQSALNRLENPDIPSAVRVAEYYAGLPNEGNGVTRQVFTEANRAPTIREIAGVQTAIQPGMSPQPLGTLNAEVDAQRQLAEAKASGQATGGAQGEAAAGLPDALADINKMKLDIANFVSHPGFATVYGKSRPLALIPGTDAANAEGRRRTLDAQAFGITIQKMRGLGALSNAEGQRVTDAFTHATNPSISEEEARAAWGEVNYYLDLAERRAQQKAGQQPQGAAPMPDFSKMSDEELRRIAGGGQ